MSPVTETIMIDGEPHEFEFFDRRMVARDIPRGLYLGFNQSLCWLSPEAYHALGDPSHVMFGYDRARQFIGLAASTEPEKGYRVRVSGARYAVFAKAVRAFLGLDYGWHEEATLSREGFLYVSYARHLAPREGRPSP